MNWLLDCLGDGGKLKNQWLGIKVRVMFKTSYALDRVWLTWLARKIQARAWQLALDNPAHSMGSYKQGARREMWKVDAAPDDQGGHEEA